MVSQLLKAVVFVLISIAFNADAFAQNQQNGFTLEFNRSPAQAVSLLEQRGFTEIKVVKRQLLNLDIEACREGVRYAFKLRLDGRIYDDRRLGRCTQQITQAQVTKLAQDSGFTKVSVVELANGFRVTGCRAESNRREQFTVDRAGRIAGKRVLGRCETRVTYEDIAEDLQSRGYDRVELVSDQRNAYVIRACRDGRQIQLQVSANGRVQSERQLGRCNPEITVADIVPLLEKAGYERVVVTDKEGPRYGAEGCREGRRFEITLNRFGKIRKADNIGRCRPRMDNDALTKVLVTEGFYNISIKRGTRARYLAQACYANRSYEIDYTRYGELVGERDAGNCRQMNPTELLATAEARGATQLEPRVRGCREGRAVVYTLDRDGVIVERARRGERCE